jgi:Tol biopolymer transport system component
MFLIAAALAIEPASPRYEAHCQAPRWSPDGRWLSWEVNDLERQTIDLYVAVAGSASPPRKVSVASGSSSLTAGFSTAAARAVTHEISFSPPSLNRFVYSSSGSAEDYDLYLDGAGAIAAAPGADGGAAWSPVGPQLAFTSARSGQGDLYLLTLGATTPPLKLSGDPAASELFPAWSPDGKKLAFVGHTRRGDSLYLIDNVEFPAPRSLLTWTGSQTRPTFSPDGTLLAFYANREVEERFDLYVVPVDGSAAPRVLATGVVLNPRGPSFTPDGKAIVYVRADDANFNPVWGVPLDPAGKAWKIPTGTVGNTDVDVVKRGDGKAWLAVTALGRTGDEVRDFRRVYTMPLDAR